MAVLAVAALSARLLAEAAARDGFDVVALDLFGDADTRLASAQWQPLAAAGALAIDPDRLLSALRELARHRGGEVIGWVPGAGFDGLPDVLAAGATLLPLIGTPADAVRRVRDPRQFFGALAAHGIAHPAVQLQPPSDPQGWLAKDAQACGGWHIRHADRPEAGPAPVGRYFQRAMPGTPMSATFIANGQEALLLGFNQLQVRPFGSHPHMYCGCFGPLSVPAEVARRAGDAVRLLTAEFGLRGWCSLDFIRGGDDAIGVLEVNPRPPASMALYAPRGQIDAQLRACLHAELPTPGAFTPARTAGSEIVYARRPLQLTETAARRLADWPDAHDLPAAGACFSMGDPVCSISVCGDGAAPVQALLSARRDALLHTLETTR